MDNNILKECIDFFNELCIEEEVISEDSTDLVIRVKYSYKGNAFFTKPLKYRNIFFQDKVKDAEGLKEYFGRDVFWLDINHHHWPKGRGEAEIEKTVIKDMIDGDNPAFEAFLKTIANNNKNGFLQKITSDGRSQQYGFNLENNNHWHDIILLIQSIIQSKGNKPATHFFERLVFNWQDDKRTSMSGNRKIINDLVSNINEWFNSSENQSMQNINSTLSVLINKKQIILQGPPGTGKTYTAKDIAEQMILSSVTNDKKTQKELLESTDQFKLIQFHPAYSYEDFVRGIVAENKNNQIEYLTKDKVFAAFAKEAYKNWKASKEETQKEAALESWLTDVVEDFKGYLQSELEKSDGKIMITGKAYINRITENSIRYDADAWDVDGGVPISDIIKMYLSNNQTRQDIAQNKTLTKTAKSLATYWHKVLELFRKYITDNDLQPTENSLVPEKKYVLIIDEINRANLPSVLGELIYALEYRGEKVESMYAIDDDNSLVIPPNLYIIGTMNTSDRSVGHIDYAIRRRFAFIDILPKIIEEENFELDLFKKVSALFIKNFDEYVADSTIELKPSEHLSEEFRPEDVWLGHSYFIKNGSDFDLRKQYEIIPILKEYVNDGILRQSAKEIIKNL